MEVILVEGTSVHLSPVQPELVRATAIRCRLIHPATATEPPSLPFCPELIQFHGRLSTSRNCSFPSLTHRLMYPSTPFTSGRGDFPLQLSHLPQALGPKSLGLPLALTCPGCIVSDKLFNLYVPVSLAIILGR